jgi:hypothetical protein
MSVEKKIKILPAKRILYHDSELFWWSYFWPEYKCPYQCENIHSTHLIWSHEIFFDL